MSIIHDIIKPKPDMIDDIKNIKNNNDPNTTNNTNNTNNNVKYDPVIDGMITDMEHQIKNMMFELNEYRKLKHTCSNSYNRKCKKHIIKIYDMVLSCRELSNDIFCHIGFK